MAKRTYTEHYIKDHHAPIKERKHMILLDGTWNDETGEKGDGLVTNIVHLSQVFENNPDKQVVRYHRGVGNDNDNGWIGNKWKGADGKGVGSIVERAYARLVQEWQHGDKIYIFGFSRGAAAARILASKIKNEGIPSSVEITLEPKENKETKVVEQRIAKVEFGKGDPKHTEIEFLGVWDTVSALGFFNNILSTIGLRKKDLFTNRDIADNIQRAVHLVGIDETRKAFVPSLMNHIEGITHEVWFPGVHSDLGGSYKRGELAQVTLHYMIDQLEKWNTERGLEDFIINDEAFNKYAKSKIEMAHFHFHGKGFGKDVRDVYVQEDGKPSKDMHPKIHKLYHEITAKGNSYSVVEVKRRFRPNKIQVTNFQYMPYNVKVLNGAYEIVDR